MELTVRHYSRSWKLCAISFTIVMLLQSFQATAQKVTISAKHVSIENILREIRNQTGYNFSCKADWVKQIGPVTVEAKDAPIPEVLNVCLSGKPFAYNIQNKTITIYPVAATPAPAGLSVSGTIMNLRNKPLDGASVVVQRSKQGTITDAKGRFTLKNIRPADTLFISFIGYTARQVPIAGETDLTIMLRDASSQLDEVVMQAYSKSSQRFITGNITKITAKEIEKQPVMNPLLALQGRVPGLVVIPTNGFASAPVKIEIRGLNSLNANIPSDPLYVIDGVPLTILSLGNTFNRTSTGFIQSINYNYPSIMTTNGQSELFSINPRDIESIEVLKDADATAVYGSRGSNGVILITTKRGKPGKTKFEFNINPPMLSVGKTTRIPKLMNTQQYLQMRREAFKNDGITPTLLNAPDLLAWDTTRYTDWGKQTVGARARNFDISAGVSGGGEQASFRINADYNRLTNTTDISGATQRATVGANISSTSRDQKFNLSFSNNFSYSYVDVITPALNPYFAPNGPPAYDKNGAPNWAEWNVDGLIDVYPFRYSLDRSNPQSTTTLASSLSLDYKPFTGLTFSVVLGYNFAYNATNYYTSISSQNPYVTNNKGSANFSTTHNSGWVINPQVTYTTRLGKGNLQLMAVATEQAVATSGVNLFGSGYESDLLLGSINNANAIFVADASSKSRNASFVGGINYNWDEKYIVNLNGTRQGSSKFGPDNKYGNFGSAGLAWIASEEKWIKRALPDPVSFLKFRGSYGLTGSDGVADYQYLALWQVRTAATGGYNNQMALTPVVRPNQKYQWESNRKLEVAANIGLLADKITLSFSYYRNRISNQLTTYPTPSYINSTNISGLVTNVPMLLQNSGWEGAVTARLISKPDFSLSADFNISRNRNILLSFPDLENTPYAGQYAVGQSVNTIYAFHFLGIDPLTGRPAAQDFNHDGLVSNNGLPAPAPGSDDRSLTYDMQPKFTGGFGINGNYKKLHFSLFFMYKKQWGRSIYMTLPYAAGAFNQNLPVELYNAKRWQKPGDIADFPALTTRMVSDSWNNMMIYSDFAISDASFIRLNNAHISYPLPEAWGKKIGLKNLTLNMAAQNVFTLTRYKGGDPETQAWTLNGVPPAGLYTFSFTYNF